MFAGGVQWGHGRVDAGARLVGSGSSVGPFRVGWRLRKPAVCCTVGVNHGLAVLAAPTNNALWSQALHKMRRSHVELGPRLEAEASRQVLRIKAALVDRPDVVLPAWYEEKVAVQHSLVVQSPTGLSAASRRGFSKLRSTSWCLQCHGGGGGVSTPTPRRGGGAGGAVPQGRGVACRRSPCHRRLSRQQTAARVYVDGVTQDFLHLLVGLLRRLR